MAQTNTDTSDSPAVALTMAGRLRRIRLDPQDLVLYSAFVALVVAFSFLSPFFFSATNFANIGRQTAMVSIMAVGMTFVIVSGQIDLSVGSIVALSSMVAALAMRDIGGGWVTGAVVALAVGAFIGFVNGALSNWLNIPSFLVTLGTLGVARGIALLLTDTRPVIVNQPLYQQIFGDGDFFGIPAPIFWTLVFLVAGYMWLQRTVFGRKVYATGGNAVAARFSGIAVNRVRIIALTLSGLTAGMAGMVFSARAHAARPVIGEGMELDVIAAVILGGTSLFGGKGTIIGAFIGSLLIGVLNNGLNLTGVPSAAQLAIKGALIIAAVAFGRR